MMQDESTKKRDHRRRKHTRTAVTNYNLVDKEKKEDEDIFDIVAKRKRDIENQEAIAKRREQKDTKKKASKKRIAKIIKTAEQEYEKNIDNYTPTCRENLELKNIESQRNYTRRARAQEQRLSIIKKLTYGTLKCPRCRCVKTNPSSWIISKDKKKVLCRSCFRSYGWKTQLIKSRLSKIELFSQEIRRYKLNSLVICRIREQLNLNVEQFAEKIGWSIPYQYKLEDGTFSTISEKTMKEICQLFSHEGFVINLNIWGTPIIYYAVEGSLIRSARKLVNLSMLEFASRCGWSSSYQHKLETNKVRKILKHKADTIQKIITHLV